MQTKIIKYRGNTPNIFDLLHFKRQGWKPLKRIDYNNYIEIILYKVDKEI
jgi:hypothetical protein